MTFDEAMAMLKSGESVARRIWNGEMWLVPAETGKPLPDTIHRAVSARGESLWHARPDGVDVAADDWFIVPPSA